MTSIRVVTILLLLTACCAAQETDSVSAVHPNLELLVRDFPKQPSQSHGGVQIIAAALENAFRDPAICCEENSALHDTVWKINTPSLEELAKTLRGRYVAKDGTSIVVTTRFEPGSFVNEEMLILPLMRQQSFLASTESTIFVVHGVTYDETVYQSGRRERYIHKLMFFNPDAEITMRDRTFDREKDHWSEILGCLFLTAERQ